MDLTQTIEANSEQVNADDLSSPRTVTITGVEKGTADQPVFIHLAEFEGRTFRPAKSVRRVIVACWGTDSAAYIGRQLTIYNDPTVKWGGQAVGGVRISHMSHIDKPLTVAVTITRGKRAPVTVQPLEQPNDTSGRDWLTELADVKDDAEQIRALGGQARAAHAKQQILDVILTAYNHARSNGGDA